jgi:hypothetical protein
LFDDNSGASARGQKAHEPHRLDAGEAARRSASSANGSSFEGRPAGETIEAISLGGARSFASGLTWRNIGPFRCG